MDCNLNVIVNVNLKRPSRPSLHHMPHVTRVGALLD